MPAADFPGGQPTANYRNTFQQGDYGWDVTALQIALNDAGPYGLKLDADFGPKTNTAVLAYQAAHHALAVDGIAGPGTQQQLCVGVSAVYQTYYKLPPWLLKSLVEMESNYAVAAVHQQAGSTDFGAFQDNVIDSAITTPRLLRAFSLRALANETASKFREQHDRFITWPGARVSSNPQKHAWQSAALYHNDPALAEDRAAGIALSDKPAQWVIDIGVRGVTTPHQWADFYIRNATIYVSAWPA